MEFAAGAAVAPRPMPSVPGPNRRVGGGAIGIGWARRATAPGLSLAPAVARRAASASGGGHGRVVVRSTGGGCLWFRGEGADGDRSSLARASPSDGAAPAR